jgi:hypothetical protein
MDVTSDGAGRTDKRARTAAERRQIEHEAAVLRRVAHPGVVQLLGIDGAGPPEVLVLRTVSRGDLTALEPQPPPVVAGLGAALATTVADLHALGFSHGGIEASHVLLDDAGRPVFCSLSRSQATAGSPDAARWCHDDLRALATLLLGLLPLPPVGCAGLARTLGRLATPARWRPRRDARWLARYLASAVPDARLPGPASAGMSASPNASISGVPARRLLGIGMGFCLLVAGVAALAGWATAADRSPGQALRQRPPTACPHVDDGCIPISVNGAVLAEPTGRYEVGRPGDVVVLGRWECQPTAFPALLRPGTGEVWTFRSWPAPDEPVVGHLVAHLPSAWSLRVLPGRSGCDQLEIDRRHLPPVTVLGKAP